jgi:hypothetical protein
MLELIEMWKTGPGEEEVQLARLVRFAYSRSGIVIH